MTFWAIKFQSLRQSM